MGVVMIEYGAKPRHHQQRRKTPALKGGKVQANSVKINKRQWFYRERRKGGSLDRYEHGDRTRPAGS